MKNFARLIALLLIATATTTAHAFEWPWEDAAPPQPILSSQLPSPPDQTTVDWWTEQATASHFKKRLYAIGDTARDARTTAYAALDKAGKALSEDASTYSKVMEVDDKAEKALTKANNFDFAGKTFARVAREMAMEHMAAVGSDSAAHPTYKAVAAKIAAKKKLSNDEEEIVATVWLVSLTRKTARQTAAPAPDSLQQKLNHLDVAFRNLQSDYILRVKALEVRAGNNEGLVRDVAHNTAIALGSAVIVGIDSTTGESIMGDKPTREDRKAALAWLAQY